VRDRPLGFALVLSVIVVLAPAVVGITEVDVYVEEASFRGNQTGVGDEFGSAVDIDGDTALVGAWDADTESSFNRGSAYIFTREGPGQWEQQARLTPGEGAWHDRFGTTVALDGDVALVGDPLEDNENGEEAGAVYVFSRGDDGDWTKEDKLLAEDGDRRDAFGTVDLDGDRAVIGASGDDFDAGSVYVFARQEPGTGPRKLSFAPQT